MIFVNSTTKSNFKREKWINEAVDRMIFDIGQERHKVKRKLLLLKKKEEEQEEEEEEKEEKEEKERCHGKCT